MIAKAVLDLLACPSCDGGVLVNGARRRPSLVCEDCDAEFPVVDGIPDLMDHSREHKPGRYRAETLFDMIAGFYDVAAPAMSLAIWSCSPLRYVDSENRARGRANGGVYLEVPVGTGFVLDQVLAPYHDTLILAVDPSWKMLRRAQKRLESHPQTVQLIRADVSRLPIRSGVVDSAQSLNGLHAYTDRVAVASEMLRTLAPGGFFSGTALVRGETVAADAVLERFERYGVYPLLRGAPFIAEELRTAGVNNVHWETHGAVLFFTGEAATSDDAAAE